MPKNPPPTDPTPSDVPSDKPTGTGSSAPTPSPTPSSTPPDPNAPVQLSEDVWSTPHLGKHDLKLFENHDPSQYLRYHAICTCGFEDRSSDKAFMDAAVSQHKEDNGFNDPNVTKGPVPEQPAPTKVTGGSSTF